MRARFDILSLAADPIRILTFVGVLAGLNDCMLLPQCFVCALALPAAVLAQLPDIESVPTDLEVPSLSVGEPGAGRRVKQQHPDYAGTEVYHVLYLPRDWQPGKHYPVIVEFAGNGPYKNGFGDVSSGLVEGSRMGYGLSGGEGFIWLCLPYLNGAGDANVTNWWGDKPDYDPEPTIVYCKKAVPWICKKFSGDPRRVVLAGFSRGAIACNFIGLHDDEIAKLWCGFIPFSHYDGVNENWPFPGAHRAAALARLARLGERPQFILGEGDGIAPTRVYLEACGIELGRITFLSTGFRNHSDAWLLRPSPAREAVRGWLRALIKR